MVTSDPFDPMSYDIYLHDAKNGDVLIVRHDLRAGTYCLGGSDTAWLNITYNYSGHFRRVLGEKGIRAIYGLTAAESLPVLDAAIAQLGTDRDLDYWNPTEGNARVALENLRLLARACQPDAIWNGD